MECLTVIMLNCLCEGDFPCGQCMFVFLNVHFELISPEFPGIFSELWHLVAIVLWIAFLPRP